MRKRTAINKAKALLYIKINMGVIKPSLKSANISRTQFYQWLKEDREFEKGYLSIQKEVKLELTSKIAQRVREKKPKAYAQLLRSVLNKEKRFKLK